MAASFLPGSSDNLYVFLSALAVPVAIALASAVLALAVLRDSAPVVRSRFLSLTILTALYLTGIVLPAIPGAASFRIFSFPPAVLAPFAFLIGFQLFNDSLSGRRFSFLFSLPAFVLLGCSVLLYVFLPGSHAGHSAFLFLAVFIPVSAASRRERHNGTIPRALFLAVTFVFFLLAAHDFLLIRTGVSPAPFALLPLGLALLYALCSLDLITLILKESVPSLSALNPLLRNLGDLETRTGVILTDLSETAGRYETVTAELSALLSRMSRGLARPSSQVPSLDIFLKTAGITARNRLVDIQNRLEPLSAESGNAGQNLQVVETIAGILEEIANKGKVVSSGVVNLTSIIDSAKKNTDKSYQIIHGIRDELNLIRNFSQTIEKISDEANTLAMSAAIESAGASDEARAGFQVVSQDLRELSSQIRNQTVEIRNVLRSLQSDLDGGIRSTESVREFFLEIQEITDKIFAQILNIVNESGSIDENVPETRENLKAMADLAAKLGASCAESRSLSERMITGMENARGHFYRIAASLAKARELADAWSVYGEKMSRENASLSRDRARLGEILNGRRG